MSIVDLPQWRVLSDLLSRAKLAAQAGVTFAGKRDLYETLGYKPNLTNDDYHARYERGGIAKRVVEVLPESTWRGGAMVYEIEDPAKTTAFEAEWEKFAERLSVWSVFENADTLAGLGEYSVIVIGAGTTGVKEPLPRLSSTDEIGYLQVYSQKQVEWSTMKSVTDRKDPRYGLPNFYSIKDSNDPILRNGAQLHWTRVIHLPTDRGTNILFGAPRLKAVWNYLDDLDKVVGGGAEASWQQASPITQFDIDKDLKIDKSDENLKAMQEQIDELVHNLRRYIRTRGVTMNTRQTQITDFGVNADAIIGLIAGTIKVPKRILIGAEAGELASSQDRNNFSERIADRREQYAMPVVVRQFMNRLGEVGAITIPKSWNVKWPEIRNLSQIEQSQIAERLTKMNTGTTVRVTTDEIRKVMMLDPLTDEQLKREKEISDASPKPAPKIGLPSAPAGGNPSDTGNPNADAGANVEGDTRKKVPVAARHGLPPVVLGEEIDWASDEVTVR